MGVSLAGLAGCLLAVGPLLRAAQNVVGATAGEVRVEVSALHGTKGHVLCALFDSKAAYKKLRPAKRLVVAAVQPITTCVFQDIAPGAYMITAVHDENDNGALDKTIFGMPKEGYGVSNNHTYALKGPEFTESAIQLGNGLQSVSIRLRYPGGESRQ